MRPAAGMQQQPTDNSQQSLFILFYERLMLKTFLYRKLEQYMCKISVIINEKPILWWG